MPSYLDSGSQDVYALNRLGSTFSDMVIGLQQNRMRQQQFMAQQAMEAARLQLERETEKRNTENSIVLRKKLGAEADYRGTQAQYEKARTQGALNQQLAGQMMGRDIQQLYSAEPGMAMADALRGDIGRQAGVIAATHPADIGLQAAQLMDLNDPTIRHLISTRSRANVTVPSGGSLVDVTQPGGQPVFTAPPRVSLRTPEQESSERLRALSTVAGNLGRGFQTKTPQYTNTMSALNTALSEVPGGAPAVPQQPRIPKPGDLYKGYRFKGGDPGDKSNWEIAQ